MIAQTAVPTADAAATVETPTAETPTADTPTVEDGAALDRERQEEIASLQDTVREVCEDLGGTAAARALTAGGPGFDQRAWKVLGTEVGLACLGLPERVGGAGGLAELAAVAEELGASLLPVPFLSSTVLAGQVLGHVSQAGPVIEAAGDEALDEALAAIAAGKVVGLAVTDADGLWRPDRVSVTFRATSGDDTHATLDGEVGYVLDGAGADALVVAARPATGGQESPGAVSTTGVSPYGVSTNADSTAGPDLFLVEATDPAVHVERVATLDLTRSQASVRLTGARATRLTRAGTADASVGAGLDVAGVVLAAEQLGGAQACLDMTVAYVRERRQFGRPIGGFQAVKHRCADLLVLVEMCRSAVDRAVSAEGTAELAEASAVAQVWCSDAYRTVTAETVQLHGGIGFTWEHDAHLYFRRARADAVLLGGSTHHRERLANLLSW